MVIVPNTLANKKEDLEIQDFRLNKFSSLK